MIVLQYDLGRCYNIAKICFYPSFATANIVPEAIDTKKRKHEYHLCLPTDFLGTDGSAPRELVMK